MCKAKGTRLLTKSRLLPNKRGRSIAYISSGCTQAKGTQQLTKSQLLPNRRGGIIAQTEVTQSN